MYTSIYTEAPRQMEYSKLIKKIRQDLDLTQKEFADKLHKKQNTVSSWEVGRTKPSVADILTINSVFGTDLKPQYDFVAFSDPQKQEQFVENTLRQTFGEQQSKIVKNPKPPYDFTVFDKLDNELETIDINTTVQDRHADIRLLTYLDQLNPDGIKEALKRVAELTEIPRYKKGAANGNSKETRQ